MSARSVLCVSAALLVAALAIFATGCGGDTANADATGAPAEVAKYIPATSPLYIELDTNIDDVQWKNALVLAERFPAYADLEQEFQKELTEANLDFDTDIRPLLGGRAAIAATEVDVKAASEEFGSDPLGATRDDLLDEAGFVGVLQLEDGKDEAVRALITREGDLTEKGEYNGVTYYADDDDTHGAVTDGFLVIADTEKDLFVSLDLLAGTGDSLSGVDKFTSALSGLEEGAIARMYVDVGALAAGSLSAAENDIIDTESILGDIENAAVGAVTLAEENGLRIKGKTVGLEGQAAAATEYEPELLERVPGDTVAYVGFANLSGQAEMLIDQLSEGEAAEQVEQLKQASGQLEALLGVTVDDLSALAEGEHAFIVTDDGGKLGVGAALGVEDGTQAGETLERLRQAIPAAAGLAGGAAGSGVPEFSAVPLENGVNGWEAPLNDDFSLVYGVDDDVVLFGSSADVVTSMQKPTPTLAQNSGFNAATAGMPEKVTSLLWLDVAKALKLAEQLGGLDAEEKANLDEVEPLKSIAAWGTGGSEPGFEIFARIE